MTDSTCVAMPIDAPTLVPGTLAALLIAFVVVEKERQPVKHTSFGESLRAVPKPFRRFLVGVGYCAALFLAGAGLVLRVGAAKE